MENTPSKKCDKLVHQEMSQFQVQGAGDAGRFNNIYHRHRDGDRSPISV